MIRPGIMTDDQMEGIDICLLVAEGMHSPAGQPRLFGEGAVAAAIRIDRSGTEPRSLTFLAEIVRRGGVAYAAKLSEPLATPEQSRMVREWLAAALLADGDDMVFARWLDAIAALLSMRRMTRVDHS